MNEDRLPYIEAAQAALDKYYPGRACAFVAGSMLRGEATKNSDIDIVVLFDEGFTDIHRRSVVDFGWPIEFFVHNPAAQDFYMEKDRKRGECVLMDMIVRGTLVPEGHTLGLQQKQKAAALIESGPPALDSCEIEDRRYHMTDKLDDLVADKPLIEMFGVLSKLYNDAGEFYLRANGHWAGQGKALGRMLRKANAAFAQEYADAFAHGFQGDFDPVIHIVERIMEPHGGRLFAGYERRAPDDWKQGQAILLK